MAHERASNFTGDSCGVSCQLACRACSATYPVELRFRSVRGGTKRAAGKLAAYPTDRRPSEVVLVIHVVRGILPRRLPNAIGESLDDRQAAGDEQEERIVEVEARERAQHEP